MTSDESHRAVVEAWRNQRYAALRRDAGWLTLAGLSWLRPGVNRVGTDPDGEIVLPGGPSHAGTVTVSEASVVADGSFSHGGVPADRLQLETDRDGGEPTAARARCAAAMRHRARRAPRHQDVGHRVARQARLRGHRPLAGRSEVAAHGALRADAGSHAAGSRCARHRRRGRVARGPRLRGRRPDPSAPGASWRRPG